MKIDAFRYKFQIPSGSRGFGQIVMTKCLEVDKKEEDQVCVGDNYRHMVRVFDPGDEPYNDSQSYYQITFRIIADQAEKPYIKLTLQWGHCDYTNGNDLFYDELNDLWYQQREFNSKNKRVKTVSSSNTVGGYTVFAIDTRSSTLISELNVDVQTSSTVTPDGYQYMIKRLFAVQDRLVNNIGDSFIFSSQSGVKIAKNEPLVSSQGEDWDFQLWKRLYPLIQQITRQPAEAIRKEYRLQNIQRIHKYDSRVIKEYYSKPQSRKIKAIVYQADHDNYENRIIKAFLKRILQRWKSNPRQIRLEGVDDAAIKQKVEQDLIEEFGKEPLNTSHVSSYSQLSCQPADAQKACTYDKYNCYYFYCIKQTDVKTCIRNPLYVPQDIADEIGTNLELGIDFIYDAENLKYIVSLGNDKSGYNLNAIWGKIDEHSESLNPIVLILTTTSSSEAVFFLEMLCRLRQIIESKEIPENRIIELIGMASKNENLYSRQKRYDYHFSAFDRYRLFGEKPIINQYDFYSIHDYCWELKKIEKEYPNYVVFQDERYEIESYSYQRYDRYNSILKRMTLQKNEQQAADVIQSLLKSSWFKNISESGELYFPAKRTPRFSFSHVYSQIYELINSFYIVHPTLNNDPNDRDFGVKDIPTIYEYWVFYELLDRLHNLGFHFHDKQSEKRIAEHFSRFIDRTGKAEGYSVALTRIISSDTREEEDTIDQSNIDIVVGFNCKLENRSLPKNDPSGDEIRGRFYTPDYYIRVTHMNDDGTICYNWYFMDAKFKDYYHGQTGVGFSLDKEILDVSIEKYIYKMELHDLVHSYVQEMSQRDPVNWNPDLPNKIQGSYLITACIQEEKDGASSITDNDRLFGYKKLNIDLPQQLSPVTEENSGQNQTYYYLNPTNVKKANDFYSTSVLGQKPCHKYGAIMFNPDDEMERKGATDRTIELQMRDEMNSLLQLIFVYKETEDLKAMSDGGKSKKRPVNLHACWDSSADHSKGNLHIRCTYGKTFGDKWKFTFGCDCSSQRFENHCYEKDCRHAFIKYTDNNFHMRYRKDKGKGSKWDFHCPHCGSSLTDYQQRMNNPDD